MGKKLREKDYRTGYEQGYKDALDFALKAIDINITEHNKKVRANE
jgi:hypothetical protein